MGLIETIFLVSVAGGFLMAFALGSNDVANSMAAAVGAKAITIRQAVFIAAGLNFIGAVFMGAHVTSTISRGIVDPAAVDDSAVMALGMLATLIAAALFVLASTLFRLPVSSTHAVIGALVGFGLMAGGPEVVQWGELVDVVLSWVLTPLIALGLSFALIRFIGRMVLRPGQMVRRARTWAPVLMGLTAAVICAAFVLDNPLGEGLEGDPLEIAGLIGAAGLVVWLLGRRLLNSPGEAGDDTGEESTYTDGLFRRMQIFTACYVALAHGSNDVANALGPVAALYLLTQHALATGQADMPVYILALGGVGIALGIGLLGHRVIRTVGERITPLDNPKGFASSFSIATTVMASSNLGLPVSSTHVAVGSVTGVGLAGGRDNVSFGLLVKIFINWVVTLPAAAGLCVAIYWLLGRLIA